jgi:tricorn protease
VPLKKDFKLPWLPTSDEEGQKDDGKSSGGGGGAPAAGAGAPPAGGPPAGGRRRRGAEGEEANLIATSPEAALVQEENKDAKKDSAASSGAAGTWNCMVRIDNAPVAVKLVLTETDGTVKGTASSIMGATELVGTYDAATGALKLSGNFNGMVFELDLKVEGDSLTGTASGPGEDGAPMKIEMTGTRVVEKKEGDGDKKDAKKEEKKEVVIDLDGFEARAVQLPAAAGSFGSLGFNDRNELLYGREGSVRVMDLSSKTPSEATGASGVRFDVSADGKKLLMGGRGGASIAGASAGASAKPIVASPMLVEIHPRHEREQILVDAWRIFRDYFYDQGMHGVDWNAIRAKYEAMLPAVVTREDLNFLIAEMISELNVGHAYLQGPGDVEETASRSVGMLGVEFAPATNEDGTPAKAWKLAKFVNGASFDNEARSPLAAQGLGVSEGDYLLAVNGEPVDPSRDPWAQFLDLAGKAVVLTVSKKPAMDKDAKDVVVTALASESNLHYRAWVESKRRQVE